MLDVDNKTDIKELKEQKKNYDKINFKNKSIRNLKIMSKLSKFLAPYVFIGSLVTAVFYLEGSKPFSSNNYNVVDEYSIDSYTSYGKKYTKKIDPNYDKNIDKKYIKNNISYLEYFGKWNKNEDGKYVREIVRYDISDIDESLILKLIDNYNLVDITLDEVFNQPIFKYYEIVDSVDDEVDNTDYICANYWRQTDKVRVKVSKEDCEAINLLYLLILSILIINKLVFFPSGDLKSELEKISSECTVIDTSEVKKLIKRSKKEKK